MEGIVDELRHCLGLVSGIELGVRFKVQRGGPVCEYETQQFPLAGNKAGFFVGRNLHLRRNGFIFRNFRNRLRGV